MALVYPLLFGFQINSLLSSWDLPALSMNFMQTSCCFPLFLFTSPFQLALYSWEKQTNKQKKNNKKAKHQQLRNNHEQHSFSRHSTNSLTPGSPIIIRDNNYWDNNIQISWASKHYCLWFCTQVPSPSVRHKASSYSFEACLPSSSMHKEGPHHHHTSVEITIITTTSVACKNLQLY